MSIVEKIRVKKPVLMMSDIDCTDKEKEWLDYVLERYWKAVFELFNIIM